jgi:hypothetical protein
MNKNKFAFPTWEAQTAIPGMTLREKFAESAMMGLLASYTGCTHLGEDALVKYAVRYADLLIAELAKEQEHTNA